MPRNQLEKKHLWKPTSKKQRFYWKTKHFDECTSDIGTKDERKNKYGELQRTKFRYSCVTEQQQTIGSGGSLPGWITSASKRKENATFLWHAWCMIAIGQTCPTTTRADQSESSSIPNSKTNRAWKTPQHHQCHTYYINILLAGLCFSTETRKQRQQCGSSSWRNNENSNSAAQLI